ncbi:MAG: polymerase subunit delta [Actinomycetota bacterium]|nr:polymerase subunit delta [Actinomycetota bacterium]
MTTVTSATTGADLYADVIGQDRAVAQLRAAARRPVHAYLLVGPGGSGKSRAAQAFAASLICPDGGCGTCGVCRRAVAGLHPDVIVAERVGAALSVGEAREVARQASLSPVEGDRKVIILPEFHLVDEAAPALLKTIEEPPPSTIFVVVTDHVPPPLVTIASRCVTIEFGPVSAALVASALVGEGVEPTTADEVALASGGSLARARLLASDPGFADRQRLWAAVPSQLDGSGSVAARLADELLASLEGVVEPLAARQAAEVVAVAEMAERMGERAAGRKELDARHKREQRRARTDELRSGLVTLARAYRDQVADPSASSGGIAAAADAIKSADAAGEALIRNPNETLLLQALLVRLGSA